VVGGKPCVKFPVPFAIEVEVLLVDWHLIDAFLISSYDLVLARMSQVMRSTTEDRKPKM